MSLLYWYNRHSCSICAVIFKELCGINRFCQKKLLGTFRSLSPVFFVLNFIISLSADQLMSNRLCFSVMSISRKQIGLIVTARKFSENSRNWSMLLSLSDQKKSKIVYFMKDGLLRILPILIYIGVSWTMSSP